MRQDNEQDKILRDAINYRLNDPVIVDTICQAIISTLKSGDVQAFLIIRDTVDPGEHNTNVLIDCDSLEIFVKIKDETTKE